MITEEQMKIIRENVGKMTDEKVAKLANCSIKSCLVERHRLGIPAYKELQKNTLCWECAKACSPKLCIWVRTLREKPEGSVTKDGDITYCPLFRKG